jgi:hypothetical protein
MAQPVYCDICGQEQAVQMLTNLETGETIAMGPGCLPVFYGQSTLAVMDAGEHKGLPQKCQACRRVHERMTLTARPAPPADDAGPANVKDQPGQGAAPFTDEDPATGDLRDYPAGGQDQAAGQ